VLHKIEVRSLTVAPPAAPRDLGPLIATLDRLGIDRVYSPGRVAYLIDFESRERIIAAKSDFTGLTFDGEQANPTPGSYNRYPAYERKVRRGRHAFVLYRDELPSIPIVPQLEGYGYRRYHVGRFAVYALPHKD
jgi:hypothetical protein